MTNNPMTAADIEKVYATNPHARAALRAMAGELAKVRDALGNITDAVQRKTWKIESPMVTGGGDPEIGYETWDEHEEWLHYARQALADSAPFAALTRVGEVV